MEQIIRRRKLWDGGKHGPRKQMILHVCAVCCCVLCADIIFYFLSRGFFSRGLTCAPQLCALLSMKRGLGWSKAWEAEIIFCKEWIFMWRKFSVVFYRLCIKTLSYPISRLTRHIPPLQKAPGEDILFTSGNTKRSGYCHTCLQKKENSHPIFLIDFLSP